MYAPFFGLSHEPFSIAPDPRYLYMSERHREALAHLLYGLSSGGGFVLLTGDIGAGKTTVCRCFLEQIPPRCNVAYIFNPKLSVTELLRSICDEFRIPAGPGSGSGTVKDYVDPLNEYLLRMHAVGQNNILIVDEAQMLSADVLEQLRLLTNLETNERKLLQIVLIGQPELRSQLAQPELEQLAQRVIARFHLGALSGVETAQYIRHRLSVAGLQGPLPFDAGALRRIHRLARGVPRRINLLCDRALLGAYATGQHRVGRRIVDKAAAEVLGPARVGRRSQWGASRRTARLGAALGGGAALLGVAVLGTGSWLTPSPRGDSTLAAASRNPAVRNPTVPPPAVAAASRAPPRAASAALDTPVERLPDVLDASAADERLAWRQLGLGWRLALPGDVEPCDAAQRQGIHCFRSNSSTLALIRQLDRPGILTLRDADDRPRYAVLTGLSSTSATVRIGGATHRVSLPSLAGAWRGDFSTFWKVPPDYSGALVQSASGPVADWLGPQLDRLLPGRSASAALPDLRARIASFQLAQGLKADGLAGPTTFMQLNRALGIDEPHLHADALPN